MTEEILSCPFCGSTEVELCRTNAFACWIRCAKCGADSDSREKREDAIAVWNERHASTPATIVDDDERD